MVRHKMTPMRKRGIYILKRRSKNGGAAFELLVRKTSRHMYVDIIDLMSGKTLTSISTVASLHKDAKTSCKQASVLVGESAASYCMDKKISPAINIADHRFHGLVKELIDGFTRVLKN